MGHMFSANSDTIRFSPEASQADIRAVIAKLTDRMYYDSVDAAIDASLHDDYPELEFELNDKGDITGLALSVNSEHSEMTFPEAMQDFAQNISKLADPASPVMILLQDHDSGDSDNMVWELWVGQGEALAQAMRDHGWEEAKRVLQDAGFTDDQILGAAGALGMEQDSEQSRPRPKV